MFNIFFSVMHFIRGKAITSVLFFFIFLFVPILSYTAINSIFLVSTSYGLDFFSSLVSLFTFLTAYLCYLLLKKNYSVSYISVGFLLFFIATFVFLLTHTNNILYFFYYYESILVLSVLLVWLSSPNRRSKQTSIYFLFWTQSGSFLVFLGCVILYVSYGITNFYDQSLLYLVNSNCFYIKVAAFLVFVGFSIKIPLWPFHFWLTKTHVEASTGFSIFLSGILVKTALLGLIKFKFIFFYLNPYFIFTVISYSMLDVVFKLYNQVDFKKLIAYSTIQEMGLLVTLVVFDSYYTRLVLLYFCFFHTTISGLFFYISEVIYRRFGSRQLNSVSGIVSTQPKLFIYTVVSLMFFMGFPLTIKFYIEIQILFKLLYSNAYFGIIFLLLIQYLSSLFFFKNVMLVLLGPICITTKSDITFAETTYFFFFLITLVSLSIC